jgi:uncharacterized RDD family membrane protein YckC/Tfp pilus assembly major pilin PilA
MEEDRTWSVTLTGKNLAGTDPQTVWQRAASMMKLEPGAFRERILDRAPLTLKAVSQSDAVRQRDAMLECGADAVALDNPEGRYLWLQLDEKVHGPVSEAYVRHAIDDGSLDRQERACIKGEHTWLALEAILQLRPLAESKEDPGGGVLFEGRDVSAAYMDLSEAAATAPASSRMDAEPAYESHFHAALPENTPGIYGGFWMRTAAILIDIVIIWVLAFAVFMAVALMRMPAGPDASRQVGQTLVPIYLLLSILLPWLYFALFESSTKQATPGKLALGLKVTDENGGRISFLRALGRNLGRYLSGLIFHIGYMMAGWTSRKQALHDMLASTFVVRKNNLETWQEGDAVGTPAGMPAWAIVLIVVLGCGFLMVPILAAISIPAYQNYLVRAQVMEAEVLSTDARRAVEQYELSHGAAPADNEAAGISSPDQIHGNYVSSVEVTDGAVVTNFGSRAAQMLQNKRITFTPTVIGQRVHWTCSGEGIAVSYLPVACRSP